MNHQRPPLPELSAIAWTVSSHSGGGGNCVSVATTSGHVLIGDSKVPDGLPQVFTPATVSAFLRAVKDGAFGLHPQRTV
ncbi:DUF397 domain-containing protein [Streptomyces sp. NPDC048290]|uniref:DUF397 domain-containing protein n=1 Tax=Streptomyces sp. NPDC048290 TaxID=3155811 RepID=UPI0034139359